MFGDRQNSSDSAWFASGLRAGLAAALALATPILLLAWYFVADREPGIGGSFLRDFDLAHASVGVLFISLAYAIVVRAAAENACGVTCGRYYVFALIAASAVGVALTVMLLDAADWQAGQIDRISVALIWVAGPWVCGGVLPILFRRRLEE